MMHARVSKNNHDVAVRDGLLLRNTGATIRRGPEIDGNRNGHRDKGVVPAFPIAVFVPSR